MQAIEDETLMRRAGEGDRSAFDQITTRHRGRQAVIAERVLHNRALAEEVAQDAMVKAWVHAARYDGERARVTTWLHCITLNLARDRLRAQRATTPIETAATIEDPAPSAITRIEQSERLAALRRGIAAMPERQRAALQLTYAEELSGLDAATRLGISTRALEGLLHRGRHFLRDWMRAREA
jgi:RNA polymerase sigma-70 factor (ECF subfamily)